MSAARSGCRPLNRAHWDIENKLHHVRDVTLNEDRCRVRASAQLAAVRNSSY